MRQSLKHSQFLVAFVKAFRLLPSDLRRARQRLARNRVVQAYLAASPARKLHIGAGYNLLPGWLNADFNPRTPAVAYLDATKTFPLADASFNHVFSEHMIEHIPFNDGKFFLRECHRILKPGGRIRVATPDLKKFAALFHTPPDTAQQNYIKSATDLFLPDFIPGFSAPKHGYRPAFVLNMFFWLHGHYFAYDQETLELALRDAGFRDITRCEPGQSSDANLAGIESHGQRVGDAMNNFETMILEAVRP